MSAFFDDIQMQHHELEDLKRPALVFAPHQDDETLGCGGTIIKKRDAGADVKIVFLCDGALSHAHLMSPEKLQALRADEARAAAQVLGVDPDRLVFLDFQEGRLNELLEDAVERVCMLLEQYHPEEIYMPYHRDIHPDHEATNRIVRIALRKVGRPVEVYEYPIWFWYHWPQVGLPLQLNRAALRLLRNTFLTGFGWRAQKDLGHAIFVGDILDRKRAALHQYKSQMTRLIPDVGWSTLGDVADGEFLHFFFQEHEVFHRFAIHIEEMVECVEG